VAGRHVFGNHGFVNRHAAIAALLLFASASSGARALSLDEDELLTAAAAPGATEALRVKGARLADQLAGRRDESGFERVVALRFTPGIAAYGSNESEPPSKLFEQTLRAHWNDVPVAAAMLLHAKGLRDPRLVELMLEDARTLASWRAQRRRDCKAVWLAGRQMDARWDGDFGSSWRFECADGRPDDPRTDEDGRLPQRAPNRELMSVEALGRAEVAGLESRIAPLLVDISRMPAVVPRRSPPAPAWTYFKPVAVPFSWGGLLHRRGYPLAEDDLAALRAAIPPFDNRFVWGYAYRHVEEAVKQVDQLAQIRARPTPTLDEALRTDPAIVPELLKLATVRPQVATSIPAACSRPVSEEIFVALLDAGAAVNVPPGVHWPPLHACSKCLHCIPHLVRRGADLNGLDQVGRVPLELALQDRHVPGVTALLEAGADPNRETPDGYSPYSQEYFGRADSEMLALMARFGGRVSAGQAARRALQHIDPRSYRLPH
jgi:hypothetical protein